MKSFKNHFSVILSLFVLLCGFEFIVLTNKIIKSYEENLIDDYSIIVVSKKAVDKEEMLEKFSIIKSIDELDSSGMIDKIKQTNITQNIASIKEKMPHFYTVKLKQFPTTMVTDNLKKQLLNYNNIDKVEIFSKTYDKIYKVLQLLRAVVLFFTCIVCFISILLIIMQLRIWIYEHQERINIMTLFGASFWTKSKALYKMAVIDSIIAAFFASALFLFCSKNEFLKRVLQEIDVGFPKFDIIQDGMILFAISFIFAIVSTTYTIKKARKK